MCSTSSKRSLPGNTPAEDFAAVRVPEPYRGVTVHKDEVDLFEGVATRVKAIGTREAPN